MFQYGGRFVEGSLMTYFNRVYDAFITKCHDTAMTKYDIPCAVNKPFHQASFPTNTKAVFQALEFTSQREYFSSLRICGNFGCR
jgi:hypothetical protein